MLDPSFCINICLSDLNIFELHASVSWEESKITKMGFVVLYNLLIFKSFIEI
jgi:hypothetical protein